MHFPATSAHMKKIRSDFLLILLDCLESMQINYAMNCKMISGSHHCTIVSYFTCYFTLVSHQQQNESVDEHGSFSFLLPSLVCSISLTLHGLLPAKPCSCCTKRKQQADEGYSLKLCQC